MVEPLAKYKKNPIRIHAEIDGEIVLVAIGGDFVKDDGTKILEDVALYEKIAKTFSRYFTKAKTKKETKNDE